MDIETEKDLWRCGICGEVREENWGLEPVIDPDGWRHVACPSCRQVYPELVPAEDGELWAHYPPPATEENNRTAFGMDEW